MRKQTKWILFGTIAAALAVGVFAVNRQLINEDKDDKEHDIEITPVAGDEFRSITMAEAAEIFAAAGDYKIVDVRRADEFADGHIPGAVNVPNESISGTAPESLPDKDEVIYVYCRSGRRSREAAKKLTALGYTNIIECGGILDFHGEKEY